MKIGRNDPCPCGSGKKYKHCCLSKSAEQKYFDAIFESQHTLKNESRIKECMHPSKNECSNKIVKAHALQKSNLLERLALDGCVITLDGQSNLIFQGAQKKGQKLATTFTGFCGYHDKTLFQEIEDRPFDCTEKQIFLMTYRTMSWHYHKKREQTNANNIFRSNMITCGYAPPNNEDFQTIMKGFELAIRDNEIEKCAFDDILLNCEYDRLDFIVWEIPNEILFAISMMHGIEHDIIGNELNDYSVPEQVKNIYLNVFPAEGKSFCIWSWLKCNNYCYKDFAAQFMELSILDRKNYLNNMLPRWSDAIIIAPSLWNKWGKDIQTALVSHANFDFLYRTIEEEKNSFAYNYSYTPWDLFEIL